MRKLSISIFFLLMVLEIHSNLRITQECDPSIASETCGNGRVDDPCEQCDDGNREGGDRCSANCYDEECGNGFKDVNEECDDGNT